MLRARRVDDYQGKRMYRVPVEIKFNDSQRCATVAEAVIVVLAPSSVDAVDWVRDQINRPETEFVGYGPRGGQTYRYMGWESHIGCSLLKSDYMKPKQLKFIYARSVL